MDVPPRFDELIHRPNQLRICAMLATVTEADFATVREVLGVADHALSKYLKALQQAGYVAITKPPRPGRRRTWVRLTEEGHAAFRGHVAELQRLATGAPPTAAAPSDTTTPQTEVRKRR